MAAAMRCARRVEVANEPTNPERSKVITRPPASAAQGRTAPPEGWKLRDGARNSRSQARSPTRSVEWVTKFRGRGAPRPASWITFPPSRTMSCSSTAAWRLIASAIRSSMRKVAFTMPVKA
jgi:hypothetical protein